MSPDASRYSPEALARRRKRARDKYRELRNADAGFKKKESERYKSYYDANREEQLSRSRANYEKRKIRTVADAIERLIGDLRSGAVNLDEFNRRYRRQIVRLDGKFAKEIHSRRLPRRSRSRRGNLSTRGSDSQVDEVKARRDKIPG